MVLYLFTLKVGKKLFYIILLCLLLPIVSIYSQVMDTRTRIDTLTTSQRLSLRTNAIDWLLLTPNIGVEYDLLNKNWSRWAIGMNLRGNWQSSHTYKPGVVYNTSGVKLELRNYYRTRQMNYTDTIVNSDGNKTINKVTYGLDPHRWWTARLFSPRRKKIKHPTTTYYRGVYLSHDNYSILLGREGKQGSAFGLGMTYGIIRPLFEYQNGSSLDFELGISGGLFYTKYDTYRHDRESNCYPVVATKDWHIVPYPVVTEIKVGFVYRFGKYAVKKKDKNGNEIEKVLWKGSYPITKKYRWRYDVDPAYQYEYDSIALIKSNWIEYGKQARKDSIKAAKDSIRTVKLNQHKADSIQKAERKANKLKIEREEHVKDSLQKDSAHKAKLEKIRLKKVDEALQDSLKARKRLEKNRDKAKKKEDEEKKKNGDTAFIIKDESDYWFSTFLITEERRRRYV